MDRSYKLVLISLVAALGIIGSSGGMLPSVLTEGLLTLEAARAVLTRELESVVGLRLCGTSRSLYIR